MRLLGPALVILVSTSTLARAGNTPDYGALDVHALVDSITDAQRAEFHIAIARWKESAAAAPPQALAIPFPHAYIVGSLEGEATYDANGNLITAGLTSLPTTYVIRIPANWNGRLLLVVPPGTGDPRHFIDFHVELLRRGYAISMFSHALPDNAGLPYDQFIGGFRTHDVGAAVFATSHLVKELVGQAFAKPLGTYMLTFSGGTLFGSGLIAGRHGSPVDGYVMVVGGNGWRTETEQHILALGTDNRIPLTGQLVTVPLTTANVYRQATLEIGLADPEYRAQMMSLILSNDLVGAEKLFFDYKVDDQPADVQRAWDDLSFDADIQAPVMVLNGTADTTQYVRNSLVFTRRVMAAGHSDMVRLYLVKDQPHAPWPKAGVVDAVEQMALWIEQGDPPGDINFDNPPFYGLQVVKNNVDWNPDLAGDPCAYFHHQFGPGAQPADCGL